MLWLNPKTPKEWVRSRRAARPGLAEKNAQIAAGIDEVAVGNAGEAKALQGWGKEMQSIKSLQRSKCQASHRIYLLLNIDCIFFFFGSGQLWIG